MCTPALYPLNCSPLFPTFLYLGTRVPAFCTRLFPRVPAVPLQGYACAKTLASLASGLALALASKFPIIPKGVLWDWFSANGA